MFKRRVSTKHEVIYDPDSPTRNERYYCRCGFSGSGSQMDHHFEGSETNEYRAIMEARAGVLPRSA